MTAREYRRMRRALVAGPDPRQLRRERLSWLWNVCWPVWVLALAMEATQR